MIGITNTLCSILSDLALTFGFLLIVYLCSASASINVMSNLIPENKCRPKVDYFYNNLLQMTYGPMHLQKTYLTSIHRMLQYFSISLCCRLGYDLLSNCNNDLLLMILRNSLLGHLESLSKPRAHQINLSKQSLLLNYYS